MGTSLAGQKAPTLHTAQTLVPTHAEFAAEFINGADF